MTPYADDDSATSIGELAIENGREQITLSGSLELTRDKVGLKRAKKLKALIDMIVEALEADDHLPAKIERTIEKPAEIKNPFALK